MRTRDWTNVDFKVIHQNANSGRVPRNLIRRDGGSVQVRLRKKTVGGIGVEVCHQGQATASLPNGGENNRCADINATWTRHRDPDGRLREGMGRFGNGDIITCAGDSGAPVHNRNNNRAYGIHHGGRSVEGFQCAWGFSYFTWISRAEDWSLHTVSTRPFGDTAGAGQRMHMNDQLRSLSGRYRLKMQTDGNLVLTDLNSGRVLWHTNTYGRPGAQAVMQTDGNFVIYYGGRAIWWKPSGANGTRGTRLVLQNDANIVMRTPSGGWTWHLRCGC